MPINILMPALSPTMEEGTLAKWNVKAGDKVASGDVIAEIETDKATMEFEAVDEGTIGEITVPAGTEGVKVNALIAVLLEDGESASDIKKESTKAEPKKAPQTDEGAGSDTPTPEPTPKPNVTPKAEGKAEGKADGKADGKAEGKADGKADGERVFASPLARRVAKDKGLDLGTMKGSGPHGRIVLTDVESAKPGAAAPKAAETAAPTTMAAGPSTDMVRKMYADREFEEVKLDGMRKIIASRLTEAKQSIPHFYLRRDIELDALLAFRAEINKSLEARGVKLSINDFIIKACALALQEVPDCNAVWAGDRVLKFKASDVAVAVAIEGGLFTPVLRDAEAKTLSALSEQMKDLAARAKTRKLAPQEYQGGSFAISNLGMMGIDNFDAVINPPHGSILAIGAGVKKPVVNAAGVIAVATVMSVTLSVDHRVIDGALGATFLAAVKAHLENPMGMLA